MENHIVSIITPSYNAEKYIRYMIESVLRQTYTKWELLITDDCSTDDTVNIVKEYMLKDKRIKLYSTDHNTGHPSTPRNISLSHARGDFIAFLDSDDVWLPFKLEEQICFMQNHKNCQLLNSYVQFINEEGALMNKVVKTKQFATYRDMLKNYELTSPTIFCTRCVAEKIHFPECSQEDYIVWLMVTREGIDIYNTQKIHAYYRVVNNSRSRNKVKMFRERWKILRKNESLPLVYTAIYLCVYVLQGIKKNFF